MFLLKSCRLHKASLSKKFLISICFCYYVFIAIVSFTQGGFARVYEVVQRYEGAPSFKEDAKTYAAKVIEKSRISRPQQREKVDVEIELLAESSGHPNIVGFHRSFEDSNVVCILLELCNKKVRFDPVSPGFFGVIFNVTFSSD